MNSRRRPRVWKRNRPKIRHKYKGNKEGMNQEISNETTNENQIDSCQKTNVKV